MTLTRHFYAILGLVTVLSAISLSSGHLGGTVARSQPMNVLVVNGSSQKVPITGTVGVSGTVAVSSLPAVQLDSGATVGINSSTVNPVIVQDKSSAGHTEISSEYIGNIPDGQATGNQTFYTVPDGKRLVLKDISINISHNADSAMTDMMLIGTGTDNGLHIMLPPTTYATDMFGQASTVSVLTNGSWVFSPDTPINVLIGRTDATHGATYVISYDGYLEDAP